MNHRNTHEETAVRLREEAGVLLERSRLAELLTASLGECAIVGSVDLSLMTWRDIDLTAPVERGGLDRFLSLAPILNASLRDAGYAPFRMVFNDEWERPRGDYGRGYYWGLRVRDAQSNTWKLDLLGVGARYVRSKAA